MNGALYGRILSRVEMDLFHMQQDKGRSGTSSTAAYQARLVMSKIMEVHLHSHIVILDSPGPKEPVSEKLFRFIPLAVKMICF